MEDPDAIFALFKGRLFSTTIYNFEFTESIVRLMRGI
jgi:hypothetical protein